MTAIFLSLVAALAALIGGLVAFNGRKRLNLTLGFTAGLVIGLVAFDLLPEIFKISEAVKLDTTWPMVALVAGFLLFHTIEKFILLHHSHENKYEPHRHPYVGIASAIAFSAHSFLDGASIGIAFQLNSVVGTSVAIAVIGHRFVDGFNTTNVMLYHRNQVRRAKQMLAIAAAMPIAGVLSTQLFTFSETVLAFYLGFFAGFILYIGASDILPQAHSKHSSKKTIYFTVLGALFMFCLSQFIGQ